MQQRPFGSSAAPARRPRAAAPLVPSVSRALALLDRLAARREPMSLAQLTSELALPKSSVHGLCNTLMSFGYLRRLSDGGFRIGPRVMGLAEAFVSGTDVVQEFNALWDGSGAAPDETTVLAVLSGDDALYVSVHNATRPLGLLFNVGMRLPACYSGTGKAMLAQLPPDEVRRRYAQGLPPPMTRKSTPDLDALAKELALVRRRGWSVDDEGVREGVRSFGAPVFDASGVAVAAVAVCLNRAWLGDDRGARHREGLLELARTLTQRLGGTAVEPAARDRHPAPTRRGRAA